MSRTDAHRPGWVQQYDPDLPASIHHDHTSGRCVEETLEYARWEQSRPRGHYWRRCAKYEVVPDECPHDSSTLPGRSRCHVVRDRYRFWLAMDEDERANGVPWEYRTRWRLPQHEHTMRVKHDDWACHCDDWPETPTCNRYFDRRYWVYVSAVYGKGVPKWYLDHVYHNPMRREARDVLRMAARDYNANGGTELEPEPRQGRHSAAWYWW